MKRGRFMLPLAIVTLLTASCSSTSNVTSLTLPSAAGASSPETPGNSPSVNNAVGCGSLTKDDLAKYIVYTQVLAQVRDVPSAKAVKARTFTDYTPAAFATILDHLSVLGGRPAQGFDDPAASLAYYKNANEILSRIVDTTGDIPQSLIDEYKTAIVNTSTAIQKQLPINAAVSVHCPNLS